MQNRRKKPRPRSRRPISAVKWALEDQGQAAPFFRFPALRHPPEMVTYLGTRNIAIFSTDMDSFDFKMRKPEQVVKSVMAKLQKHGKGIVLMHDFQKATSEAVPQLLAELKAGGYKIVHMRPRDGRGVAAAVRRGASSRTPSCRPSARGRYRAWFATSSSRVEFRLLRGGRKAAPLHLRGTRIS